MSKIKICGLFRQEDISAVNEARPDYIGFVFASSRRQVSVSTAAALREKLVPDIVPVGVFVREEISVIAELAAAGTIEMVQLHGGEDDCYIRKLRNSCDLPIISAISVPTLKLVPTFADFYLLDNGSGGTGTAFNWSQIPALDKPYFLAGGIGLHNLDEALRLRPYCIDVSSGAESRSGPSAGLKNSDKISSIVKKVRSAHYV